MQVFVTWQQPLQPNGVIRHYEVTLLNIYTRQTITKFVNGITTSVTLNHLHPNHQYSCSVAAHSVVRGSVPYCCTNYLSPSIKYVVNHKPYTCLSFRFAIAYLLFMKVQLVLPSELLVLQMV